MLSKKAIEKSQIWIKEKIEYIVQNCDLKDINNKRALLFLKIANKSLLEKQKQDKMIKAMAAYISEISDCPRETKNIDLDCKNRCALDIEPKCWKLYFEKKVS